MLTPGSLASLGAVLGVSSHLGYFIHGEHHRQAVRLFTVLTTSPVAIFILISKLDEPASITFAAQKTAIAMLSYLASLIASILTYRIFFHPLRHFPGPFTAKLTKLSHVLRLLEKSDNYIQADQLHKEYGDVVRIGPNELSIKIPEIVPLIYGPGSKCSKIAWYDVVGLPNKSLQLERDRLTHDKRRKVWDRAFTLRDYESRVVGHASTLINQLQARSGHEVDASLWFNFYSFDVMGDLAFGRSFDMLISGKKHYGLEALQEGMAPLGIINPLPWAIPIFQALPQPAGIDQWVEFSNKQILARKKYTPENPDIMSWLIEAENGHTDPVASDPRWLWGDTRLVIVVGSDTTSSALTHIFYHLAKEPHIVSKLWAELELIYTPDARYLNGVINEALRLHPLVLSGLLRQTPPEGTMVGNTFILGGIRITVLAPTWSMGRLESCYESAEEFLPERWGERPELVLNKAVFMPFSLGTYSCIGKQLALMELRVVTARIVTQLDIAFAPGKDDTDLLEKTKDVFTLEVAPLGMVFSPRRK
ncbi:cytochrome P450 monooxygenase-like protein [Hyaloscypha bicolor E]|uniref:Cytochrome P450 monooxygenase-like protein n=1 Tax=Hyaloscypha bicolor E TaxID=1095630 RepID=A0A2J6TW04_9HELO|nr:cytochrome P450 monooxygenase-like protein [Hyaloscypha bicolor E]PMD67138.1 cytochrome P450 monooxygenase-like protein [Hyaloscypha bicolor E]